MNVIGLVAQMAVTVALILILALFGVGGWVLSLCIGLTVGFVGSALRYS